MADEQIDPLELRRRLLFGPLMDQPPQRPNVPTPPAPPAQPQYSTPPPPEAPPIPPTPGPGPAQAALESALKNRPQMADPQFHQGKGRTILNAIAGGLAGLRSPEEGIKVGHELRFGPYERAVGQYQGNVAALQPAATAEQERTKHGLEEYKAVTGAKREGAYANMAQAHANYFNAIANIKEPTADHAHIDTHSNPLVDEKGQVYELFFNKRTGEMNKMPTGLYPHEKALKGDKPTEAAREAELEAMPSRTPAQEKELGILKGGRNIKESHVKAETSHLNRTPQTPFISPSEVGKAQNLAASDVTRARPEFAEFLNSKGEIKPLHEVINPPFFSMDTMRRALPGGGGAMSPVEVQAKKNLYNNFLGEIQKRQRFYESQAKGQGSPSTYSEVK